MCKMAATGQAAPGPSMRSGGGCHVLGSVSLVQSPAAAVSQEAGARLVPSSLPLNLSHGAMLGHQTHETSETATVSSI